MGNTYNGSDTLFSGIYFTIVIISFIITIIPMWKIFQKANMLGYYSIIPIFNSYKQFEMVYGNGWLMLLLLIPFVNIFVAIMFSINLGKCFGKSTGFCIGLLLLPIIFLYLLAFDDSEYLGPKDKMMPNLD